jgi:hypothetical protein
MLNQWAPLFKTETLDSTATIRTVFHVVAGSAGLSGTSGGVWASTELNSPDNTVTWYEQYQEDICLSGLSMIVFLHPTIAIWPAIVSWFVQQQIARLADDGGVGWGSGWPTIYGAKTSDTQGSLWYPNYQIMWQKSVTLWANPVNGQQANIYGPPGPPSPTVMPVMAYGQYDYYGLLGMALNLAWQAGHTEVTAASTKLWTRMLTDATLPQNTDPSQGKIPIPAKYGIKGPVT